MYYSRMTSKFDDNIDVYIPNIVMHIGHFIN